MKDRSNYEPINHIITGQKISSAKLQRAKELRRQMTPEEKILWQHLRTNRLNRWHFRRQQIIDGFIVDFYCHAAGLVIEKDFDVFLAHSKLDKLHIELINQELKRLARVFRKYVSPFVAL